MNCKFCSKFKAVGFMEGNAACAQCMRKRDDILGIHKLTTKCFAKENEIQPSNSRNK